MFSLLRPLAKRLLCRPGRVIVPLCAQHLVAVAPQIHTQFRPRTEVVLRRHRPARPLALSHADVLMERACAFDGRLVRAGRLINVVSRAVGGDGALGRAELPG